MWPLKRRLWPPPVPANRAAICGRPSKPTPGGRRRRPRRWVRIAAVLCLCALALAAGYGAHSLVSGGGEAAAPPLSRTTVTVTTTTPVTTTPPAPPPGRPTISIAAVGDTMLGSTPGLPPSPGTHLAALRAGLRGGHVFGDLAGTLTDTTTSKSKAQAEDTFGILV